MASTDPIDAKHSTPEVDSVDTIRDRMLAAGLLQHIDLETAEEFAVAISPFGSFLRNRIPPASFVFRGVDNTKHDLVPSGFRPECPYRELCPRIHLGDFAALAPKHQVKFELSVLARFFRLADSQGLALPEDSQGIRRILDRDTAQATYLTKMMSGQEVWPPPSMLSIMGLAQHHGLPTRLLDWSRNPFKAAYFAARQPAQNIIVREADPDNRLAVWAMSTSRIDAMHVVAKLKVGGTGHFPVRIITVPAVTNVNLKAQEGVFSLFPSGELSG